MRIVLDTNVLVSGLLNPRGAPGRIVDLIVGGELVVMVDDRILAEYRDVLRRPLFGFAAGDVGTMLDFLTAEGVSVSAPPLPPLPDPGDQPFLEVAVAATADSLVTGNLRHFPARRLPAPLRVESPAAFLRRAIADLS